MTQLSISPIPAFSDNYIWCITSGADAVLVDPGEAAPALAYLREHHLQLTAILVTHHHPDHVGGIGEIIEKCGDLPVIGPKSSTSALNSIVADGDTVTVHGVEFTTIGVPGHTLDHVAYFCAENKLLFCGDTLFAGGCGRLFEGTPEQMLESLGRLQSLPVDTRVYCAHEYTLNNLRFALKAEPENADLQQRYRETEALRAADRITLPSTIDVEQKTNPFLRSAVPSLQRNIAREHDLDNYTQVEIFAALRAWKDNS